MRKINTTFDVTNQGNSLTTNFVITWFTQLKNTIAINT